MNLEDRKRLAYKAYVEDANKRSRIAKQSKEDPKTDLAATLRRYAPQIGIGVGGVLIGTMFSPQIRAALDGIRRAGLYNKGYRNDGKVYYGRPQASASTPSARNANFVSKYM